MHHLTNDMRAHISCKNDHRVISRRVSGLTQIFTRILILTRDMKNFLVNIFGPWHRLFFESRFSLLLLEILKMWNFYNKVETC